MKALNLKILTGSIFIGLFTQTSYAQYENYRLHDLSEKISQMESELRDTRELQKNAEIDARIAGKQGFERVLDGNSIDGYHYKNVPRLPDPVKARRLLDESKSYARKGDEIESSIKLLRTMHKEEIRTRNAKAASASLVKSSAFGKRVASPSEKLPSITKASRRYARYGVYGAAAAAGTVGAAMIYDKMNNEEPVAYKNYDLKQRSTSTGIK